MPTPRIERETTVSYNEEESVALVWSASPVFQRKMAKRGVEPYQRDDREDVAGLWYRVPKRWVKVSPPRNMQLSDEQRAKMGERLKTRRERDDI